MKRVEPRTPATRNEEIVGAELPGVRATASEPERLARIEREFMRGFEALAGLRPAVCVFGSRALSPSTLSTRSPARPGGGSASGASP